MWSGKVRAGHVLRFVEQLQLNPYSRVRMIQFGGDPRWIGWDSTTEAVAAVHDALVAIANGLGGSKSASSDAFYPRPNRDALQSEKDLFAPSIAEFNVGRFMSIINGS